MNPPSTAGGNDGAVITPTGRHAVLEVKGRERLIKLADVRQLIDWVDIANRADDERDAVNELADAAHNSTQTPEWTGLMVCNPQRLEPLDTRSVEPLAPNARQRLDLHRLGCVTTLQIFQALCDLQDEQFDSDAWWEECFPASPPDD